MFVACMNLCDVIFFEWLDWWLKRVWCDSNLSSCLFALIVVYLWTISGSCVLNIVWIEGLLYGNTCKNLLHDNLKLKIYVGLFTVFWSKWLYQDRVYAVEFIVELVSAIFPLLLFTFEYLRCVFSLTSFERMLFVWLYMILKFNLFIWFVWLK